MVRVTQIGWEKSHKDTLIDMGVMPYCAYLNIMDRFLLRNGVVVAVWRTFFELSLFNRNDEIVSGRRRS